jgi:ABC-type polysaccharide/polyol phosphate transport system ATPase subunit
MSSEPVIEFNNVWKKYSRHQVLNNSLREELMTMMTGRKKREELADGEFWALRDLSFVVRRGDCVGLCGPNGSGKSTILKLVSNVTHPTRGSIAVRSRVAPLIELGAGMHPDLTGSENIYMNGTILGLSIRELQRKVPEIVEFSGLEEFIHAPVKKYSSGMYLRLAFSIAVHSPAEILLFDEVLTVGDEDFQRRCEEKIKDLMAAKKTIFIVSHAMEMLDRFANRKINLSPGRASVEDA